MKKVLVANRGEIAQSAIRCIREMGIETAAVCSQVEPDAIHIRNADQVFILPGGHMSLNYNSQERILECAQACKADAVYCGYGFLSEVPEFARACADRGITFIGPDAGHLEHLRDKPHCLETAASLGIATPVHSATIANEDDLVVKAADIGYPVFLKPHWGSGGRRILKAYRREDLLESYRGLIREREIRNLNIPYYLEKSIRSAVHLEFPVLADQHGHVVHFGERECVVQRRYQKIISETPSPRLKPETRQKMAEAALGIVRKLGFVGCGAVEFLLDPAGRWYFLEINPRIPVEYALTDLNCGVELIKEQVRIAAGEKLRFKGNAVTPSGHAVECRVNAEDPERDFRPSAGVISEYYLPGGYGYSVQSSVQNGMQVDIYFDPMILKLDCFAPTREETLSKLRFAMSGVRIKGIRTNLSFIRRVIHSKEFVESTLNCDFKIEDYLTPRSKDKRRQEVAAIVTALEHELGMRAKTPGYRRMGGETSNWNLAGRLALLSRRDL